MKVRMSNKFLILNSFDMQKYLTFNEIEEIKKLKNKINAARSSESKKENEYLILNKDESCAHFVENIILEKVLVGEIVELIATNYEFFERIKDTQIEEVQALYYKNKMLNEKLYCEGKVK